MSLHYLRDNIGGEFFFEPAPSAKLKNSVCDYLSSFNAYYFNSGRSAIRSVLKKIDGKKALLPAYICKSVINAFLYEGYSIEYYNNGKDMSIDMDSVISQASSEVDVIFIMNYYGNIYKDDILRQIKKICLDNAIEIIEDTTHSIFTKPVSIGDYCVASLRKWFALPDGGVVYTTSGMNDYPYSQKETNLISYMRATGMYLKSLYMKGRLESDDLYLGVFERAEAILDNESEVGLISDYSAEMLKYFDIAGLKEKRRENVQFLMSNIDNKHIQRVFDNIQEDACPIFLPLYAENRDDFRTYLMQNSIYCPIHWPIAEEIALKFQSVKFISENIISIPIDQRYSIDDMKRVCRKINEFIIGK